MNSLEAIITAQVDVHRAIREEKEAFRPRVRETARREGLRAEEQFIAARLQDWAAVLNTRPQAEKVGG